ncbi:MAG TPA: hypothetical protein VN114_09680 [Oxalicibacterium sp.]|uniref:hypothetical protein n=1 Tax=Oxalicibacterium sp. TaxID=2766525 RepID=UPI002C41C969|nr:hypothetical protein [Oxalicibacterium sp.]HWU98771.1 hypothetical protein [Oxalicibacterium sp.]
MTKLQTMFAGVALAMFSQFAAAQSTGVTTVPAASAPPAGDPAYTDQSRANRTNDPYVKKRVQVKEAKQEYKADKAASKAEYKADKAASKEEYKDAKKAAKQERREAMPLVKDRGGALNPEATPGTPRN